MRATTAAEYTAKQRRRAAASKPRQSPQRNRLVVPAGYSASFGPTRTADRQRKATPILPGASVWAVLAAMAGRRRR